MHLRSSSLTTTLTRAASPPTTSLRPSRPRTTSSSSTSFRPRLSSKSSSSSRSLPSSPYLGHGDGREPSPSLPWHHGSHHLLSQQNDTVTDWLRPHISLYLVATARAASSPHSLVAVRPAHRPSLLSRLLPRAIPRKTPTSWFAFGPRRLSRSVCSLRRSRSVG